MEDTTTMEYMYDSTTYAPETTFAVDTTDVPFLNLAAVTPDSVGDRLLHSGEQLSHNQITFEIPSHHDLEHINKLHTFNTLLQRIGNVAYDTVASASAHRGSSVPQEEHHALRPFGVDATGQHITNEQISKSAVLNLAELKNGVGSVGGSFLEGFFGDADMHAVINYLWIGVVTALVVLSVIFILFSCYFYRKFRQWKKCSKYTVSYTKKCA
uniref:Protein commissureless n=1 Tax=Bactrocera latifrons TaxID=174628 RepID=A0A0K8UHF1_BACLA